MPRISCNCWSQKENITKAYFLNFPKVHFTKVNFPKVYFPKVFFFFWKFIFRKCIFRKCICLKCIFAKCTGLFSKLCKFIKVRVAVLCQHAVLCDYLVFGLLTYFWPFLKVCQAVLCHAVWLSCLSILTNSLAHRQLHQSPWSYYLHFPQKLDPPKFKAPSAA